MNSIKGIQHIGNFFTCFSYGQATWSSKHFLTCGMRFFKWNEIISVISKLN